MDELLKALASELRRPRRHFACGSGTRRPNTAMTTNTPTKFCDPVFDAVFDEINGRPNTKGGVYRVNYLSTTCHVYFGSVTGATPDGRHAWAPHLRRHLARAGRRPSWPHGGSPICGQNGSRPHRRHAAEPEVHASTPRGRRRASRVWLTWCAHISRWTATTSSSTSSGRRRFAQLRRIPSNFGISSFV